MKQTSKGVGIFGFLAVVLTAVFMIMKFTGYIAWSWVWVLAPLWIYFSLTVFVFVVIFVLYLVVFRNYE